MLGQGSELALGLSVSANLSADVLAYIQEEALPIDRFVHLAVSPGPGNTAMSGPAQALGWALHVKERLSELARAARCRKLHLFIAAPGGAALFLGHRWNRLPDTQLYEDLYPGYQPSYRIPG